MATALSSPVVSPATTHCSELEYLIALQDTENSQLRRSQRLRDKHKSKSEVAENVGKILLNTSGSPQLFVETDEECSQLAQVLQASSLKYQKIVTKSDTDNSRPNNHTQIVQQSKSLQSEPTLVSLQTNLDCKISTLPEPNILSLTPLSSCPLKIRNEVNPSQLLKKGRRRSKTPKKTVHINKIVSLKPASTPVSSETQHSDLRKSVRPRKRKSNLSTSVTKRNRLENSITTVCDKVKMSNFDQNYKQQSSVLPLASNPNILYAKATEGYTYHNLNVTQTFLPERYPAHFMYQLPPNPNLQNEMAITSDGKRVSLEAPISLLTSASLREMCPTPNMTPLVDIEDCTPSPSIVESIESTTPSLSESLAEVFGTKKVHEVLNIEIPRKYVILEDHLPPLAIMLDVELPRLSSVLGLTQRLTPEQMQQMTKESLDVRNVHSEQ